MGKVNLHEVGIPLGILLTSGNRKNIPTSLGQVNPNTAAAEYLNLAPGLIPSSQVDPGRLEFSLPQEEPGCAHRTYLNLRYSADPLQAILNF